MLLQQVINRKILATRRAGGKHYNSPSNQWTPLQLQIKSTISQGLTHPCTAAFHPLETPQMEKVQQQELRVD